MSDFEYLGRMGISQYLPLKSFLHQRDPRAKLAGIALLVLGITITGSLSGAWIGLLVVGFLLFISSVPARYALRSLLPPLPFLLILAALQVFIAADPEAGKPLLRIWHLAVTWNGLGAALLMLLKFSSLIILFSVSSAAVSSLELIHGVHLLLNPFTWTGIQFDSLVMTLQITVRFIPLLMMNAERIAKSQASRGAEWGKGRLNLIKRVKRLVPLLVPLFSGSLRQAETLAEAMLARGFQSGGKRTGMNNYTFEPLDALFLAGCGLAAFLILLPVY